MNCIHDQNGWLCTNRSQLQKDTLVGPQQISILAARNAIRMQYLELVFVETRTARACHGSHLQGTHRVPAGSIGIKSNGKEKRTSMPSVHVCLRILKKRALNFSRKEYGSRISTLFRLEQSRSIPSGPWVTLGALVGLRTAFARHNRTPPCDMGTRGSGGSQACKDFFLCVQMFWHHPI